MQLRKTGLSEDGAVFFYAEALIPRYRLKISCGTAVRRFRFFYALQRVFFQNAAAFCKDVKTIGINPSVYMK